MPLNPIQHNNSQASTLSSSNLSQSDESKKDKSASKVHKPIVSFSNKLKNNKQNLHMDKIIEIFNQVKVNVSLLDAIQQVPSYAKFLEDLCTKKRKTNVPKKVFLATNISEVLSGPIPVKYKNPGCPTIACTIDNPRLVVHSLTWEQVLTCFHSQFINNSGWAILVQLESLSNWLVIGKE